MIYFLVAPIEHLAKEAGIKVPDDVETFVKEEFPHFWMFMYFNVGTETTLERVEHNADILAKLTEDQVMNFTVEDFINAGVSVTI